MLNVRCMVSLLIPLSLTPTHTWAEPAWVNRAMGDYHSVIWSVGQNLDGMTRLRRDASGMSGDYTMQEQTGTVLGQLFECQPHAANTLHCIWSDRYGVGLLVLVFSDDFLSFKGQWQSSQGTLSASGMRWDGTR